MTSTSLSCLPSTKTWWVSLLSIIWQTKRDLQDLISTNSNILTAYPILTILPWNLSDSGCAIFTPPPARWLQIRNYSSQYIGTSSKKLHSSQSTFQPFSSRSAISSYQYSMVVSLMHFSQVENWMKMTTSQFSWRKLQLNKFSQDTPSKGLSGLTSSKRRLSIRTKSSGRMKEPWSAKTSKSTPNYF